jgi:hypothetical protein
MTKLNRIVKNQKAGDGDELLWLGLMVWSGSHDYMPTIRACQGSSGMFYRSPDRVDKVNEDFSRDMGAGLLLTFPQLENEKIEKWVNFCKEHKWNMSVYGDRRKTMTIGFKGRLWLALYKKGLSNLVPWYWFFLMLFNFIYLPVSAKFTPKGYQMHLVAVALLLFPRWFRWLPGLTLWKRSELNNPFYEWLSGGKTHWQQIVLDHKEVYNNANGNSTQWYLERDINKEPEVIVNSMPETFLFLDNLKGRSF